MHWVEFGSPLLTSEGGQKFRQGSRQARNLSKSVDQIASWNKKKIKEMRDIGQPRTW